MGSNKYKYELVKQHVDGLQYISQHVRLKKVGQIYRGICPFHSEKGPSFTVYPKGYMNPKTKIKQNHATFYCFGCGVTGDVISFKQLKENCEDRVEACDLLSIEAGLTIDEDKAQQDYLAEQLKNIRNSIGNTLSLAEINLACSSMCRNYLLYVKEYFQDKWEDEIKVIEKYYIYFDATLPERNSIEAMDLIDEVKEKLNKRRTMLKETNNEQAN